MKATQLILGLLASTAIARTTFLHSDDPCKDKYELCKAPKDPKMAQDAAGKKLNAAQLELKCGCEQTACLGEDSARNRDYCDKVKKNNWIDPDAKPAPPPPTAPNPNLKPPTKPMPKPAPKPMPKPAPKPMPKPMPKPAPMPPADPCQDKYTMCKSPKDPKEAMDAKGKKYNAKQLEHKCGCALQACVGEDNARGREYCDKLKNNDWVDVDAGEKPPPLF